jgi:hypothetical protein
VDHGGEEQHLSHGQATTTAPHLGSAGIAGMPSTGDGDGDLAEDTEKKEQRTPRRRTRSPNKTELERIEQHGGALN